MNNPQTTTVTISDLVRSVQSTALHPHEEGDAAHFAHLLTKYIRQEVQRELDRTRPKPTMELVRPPVQFRGLDGQF